MRLACSFPPHPPALPQDRLRTLAHNLYPRRAVPSDSVLSETRTPGYSVVKPAIMLAGLLRPSAGNVFLDGTDIYSLNDKDLSRLRNDHFGVIPQAPSILASLNVAENILLPLMLYKKKNENHYARRLMEMLGIFDLAYESPTELSGGQVRRVAIARALVTKPSCIFADEPTGDLDEENTQIVLSCLRQIADEGACVLLVTHDIAAKHCEDRMLTMKDGILSESCNSKRNMSE